MIRKLVVLTLYFVGFHTFGKIFSYLTVNLITAYLLICQPKSIWKSLLVFTILIFSGSLQLKPLILIMITCATIVFRAVTTLHIASTNFKLNFLDVLVIHVSLFYIIM